VESLAPKAWQYGVLGVVALAFAYAIIHLFRALRAQTKSNEDAHAQMAKERTAFSVEREAWTRREVEIRFEYEKRHRELVQDHAKQLRDSVEQEREAFADLMAQVQSSAEKQSAALVATMEKFYDRFLGQRRGF
jgi:hypothetical protein